MRWETGGREILNKSLSLSDREKDMVLDMIQHLGKLHTTASKAKLPSGAALAAGLTTAER